MNNKIELKIKRLLETLSSCDREDILADALNKYRMRCVRDRCVQSAVNSREVAEQAKLQLP